MKTSKVGEAKMPFDSGLSSSLMGLITKYTEAVQARLKAERERDELQAQLDRLRHSKAGSSPSENVEYSLNRMKE